MLQLIVTILLIATYLELALNGVFIFMTLVKPDEYSSVLSGLLMILVVNIVLIVLLTKLLKYIKAHLHNPSKAYLFTLFLVSLLIVGVLAINPQYDAFTQYRTTEIGSYRGCPTNLTPGIIECTGFDFKFESHPNRGYTCHLYAWNEETDWTFIGSYTYLPADKDRTYSVELKQPMNIDKLCMAGQTSSTRFELSVTNVKNTLSGTLSTNLAFIGSKLSDAWSGFKAYVQKDIVPVVKDYIAHFQDQHPILQVAVLMLVLSIAISILLVPFRFIYKLLKKIQPRYDAWKAESQRKREETRQQKENIEQIKLRIQELEKSIEGMKLESGYRSDEITQSEVWKELDGLQKLLDAISAGVKKGVSSFILSILQKLSLPLSTLFSGIVLWFSDLNPTQKFVLIISIVFLINLVIALLFAYVRYKQAKMNKALAQLNLSHNSLTCQAFSVKGDFK